MFLIAIGYRQVIQIHEMGNMGFFLNQLPGFFDLYAFGMLSAYLLTIERKKIFEKLVSKLFFLALSILTAVLLFFMMNKLDSIPFSPNSAYIWQADNRQYLGLLFLLFSVASCFSIKIWQNIFSNRILVFISTISYNLFIWHQFIAIQLKKNHIPYFFGDPHKDINWQIQYTLLVIVLSLSVSVVISYLFEEPIKKRGVKKYIRLILTRVNLL